MKPSWSSVGSEEVVVQGAAANISALTQITMTSCLQSMLLFGVGGIEVGYTGIVGSLSPVTYDMRIGAIKRPECLEVRKKPVCLHWAHLLCIAGLSRLEMNPTAKDVAKTVDAWNNIYNNEKEKNG